MIITPIINQINSIKIPFKCSISNSSIHDEKIEQDTFDANSDNIQKKLMIQNELLKIENVHCPVCGKKMLTREQFKNILKQAQNITTPQEYYELLKENAKYLPKNHREIITTAKNILEENPDIEYKTFLSNMREAGNIKFKKCLEENIDYMNKKLDTSPLTRDDETYINKYINRISAYKDENYPYYKILDIMDIINTTISKLETNEKDKFYWHMFNSISDAHCYRQILQIKNFENNSDSQNSQNAFYSIFHNSVSKACNIIDNKNTNDNPNNVILLCGNCTYNREDRKTFYSNKSDPQKVRYRFNSYLEDIVQAIGCRKTENLSSDYIYEATNIASHFSNQKLRIPAEDLREKVNHINFIKFRPEFLPESLEEDIPCSSCGTTMVNTTKKRDLNNELLEAKTLSDIVDILDENRNYINPAFYRNIEFIKDLIKENPDITSEDIMSELKIKVTLDTNRYLKKIIRVCRQKVAKNIGTPQERQQVLNFADNLENWRLKHPRFEYFDYGKYSKFLDNTSLYMSNDSFHLKYAVKTKLRQIAAINNLAFQSPASIERYNGDELKAYVEKIFRMSSFTMDHYQPKDRGGKNNIENLTGMCKMCNAQKSNHTPLGWLKLNPNSRFHTIENLKKMDELIEEGKLPGYENYPAKAALHQYKMTEGKLDLRWLFPFKKEESKK